MVSGALVRSLSLFFSMMCLLQLTSHIAHAVRSLFLANTQNTHTNMPHPSLIEWTLDDGRTVVLIFQGKAEPRLEAELRNTMVWPNRCPDDGTLFLEGTPKDYIEMPICLEPPGARPQCILTAALVLDMGGRKTCSFGDVTKGDGGGNGPGL